MKYTTIFTDGEPDDLFAIHILAHKLRDTAITLVVGEGKNVQGKAARLHGYFPLFNVYVSEESHKTFPEPCIPRKPFPCVSDVGISALVEDRDIYVLKPPRELLTDFSANDTATLWYYGSFNTRSCLKTFGHLHIQKWLESFKCTYVYESYRASGEQNVVNMDTCPALMSLVLSKQGGALLRGFHELMERWDTVLMDDCKRACLALDPTFPESIDGEKASRYARRYKTYHQLEAHKGRQFVLADVGLAVTEPCDYMTAVVSIDPDTGYTEFKYVRDSNVHLISHRGFDVITERIRRWLCDQLNVPLEMMNLCPLDYLNDPKAAVARSKLAFMTSEWELLNTNLQTMKDATKALFTNVDGTCESLLFLSNRQSGKFTMMVRYLVALMTETTHRVKLGIYAPNRDKASEIMRTACLYMNIQLPMDTYSAIVHSGNGSLVHLKCVPCRDEYVQDAYMDVAVVFEPGFIRDTDALSYLSKHYPCIMVCTDGSGELDCHKTRIIDQRIMQGGVEHPEFIPPWKKSTL
jgi:hypothetical protein